MEIFLTILQIIGGLIGILLGLFIIELAIVAFTPGFSVPKQSLTRSGQIPVEKKMEPSASRRAVSFDVKGTSLKGWLYLPEDLSSKVPCIIMGHGLGGTMDMGLDAYATRYREAGFAVLIFDYRHFGASSGEPRQLVWIPYQLEDYMAAIKYVRSLSEIDPMKIALWGTSLSGGHVIVIAAKDIGIACIISQAPWLDGLAAGKYAAKIQGVGHGFRLMMHGQRDLVRSWFGLPAHKMPLVGKSGSIAVLPFTEAFEAFEKLATENFINEVCARIMIRIDKYRPIKKARKVHCPVLIQICDNDEPIPLNVIDEAVNKMGQFSEVKHYPIAHFDIYIGENFEQSVSDQLTFLRNTFN